MTDSGFHICYQNNQKHFYHLKNAGSGRQLCILPFEHYHAAVYGINDFKKTIYTIPEKHFYYAEKANSEITEPGSVFHVPEMKCVLTRSEYVETVLKIKKHIQRGDIYEMNFCFEFFAENAVIDPLFVFEKLYRLSKAPFASLTKISGLYILCCSPERFIRREGNKIFSEPMKGTAPRNPDPEADEKNKIELQHNPKEQNENVMIVDLVRNDLSKIAEKGSVKVEELFGVKTFTTVHQMISTISCMVQDKSTDEILEAAFPMGSMTGAPKKRTLELVNQYEKSARGIYSGTIGIIEPDGDFDLAVVIRSIVYDAKKKYLSFSVGSAITAGCDPEQEYEECLLKAKTMMEVLKP